MKKIDKSKVFLDAMILCLITDFSKEHKNEYFEIVQKLDKNRIPSISIEEIEKQLSNKYDLSKVVVTLIIENFNKGLY